MPQPQNDTPEGTSVHAPSGVLIRPIRKEDREGWLELMRSMSWATRFKRGARRAEELDEADIARAVDPRPGSEVAFVAIANAAPGCPMIGVARGTLRDGDRWDFTIVLLDAWQGRGIGSRLMRELIARLRAAGARRIEGEVLATNRDMLAFVGALGFTVEPHTAGAMVRRVVLEVPAG
jgi:acetyltransferase